jgi:Fe-S cluster biogenesis protein NfuA
MLCWVGYYQTWEVKMREKVEEALKLIRPSLQADGGNVELVEVTDDGVVKVRLTGACSGCPMSQMTLRSGVERIVREQVPEVKAVESV